VPEVDLPGEDAASPGIGTRHGWVLWRLAAGVLILFAVSVLVFAATQALPGDPARAILGREATPERLSAVRAQLRLDEPLVSQYGRWAGGVLKGDFGTSLAAQVPVTELLGRRLGSSLALLAVAVAIALPLSLLLGTLMGLRRDGLFDKTFMLAGILLVALPEFVIGMALVMLLATTVFTLLPAVALIPAGDSPFAHPRQLVLPVLTLVLATVPYLSRLLRGSMIDVLESEYVHMARLKGMPERIIVLRHALPNAVAPTLQASALVLAYLLSGIVVVEYLFRYPGLGGALTDAVGNRDLPVIQAITLIFAAGIVGFNLVADVLTVYVTPRLRTGRGT
jgi:peptide/nickel transport system permease protein